MPPFSMAKPSHDPAGVRLGQLRLDERTVQSWLFTILIISYLIVPARLPNVPSSIHGLVLLVMLVVHLSMRAGQVSREAALPYLVFITPTVISTAFSPAGFSDQQLRTLVLGCIAGYLTAYYAGDWAFLRPSRWFIPALFITALLSTLALVFTSSPISSLIAASGVFLGWGKYGAPVLYGMFLIAGTLLVATRSITLRNVWLLGAIAVFILAITINASRGVWVGLVAGVLAFAVLARRLLLSALILGMLVASFYAVDWMINRPMPPAQVEARAAPPVPAQSVPPQSVPAQSVPPQSVPPQSVPPSVATHLSALREGELPGLRARVRVEIIPLVHQVKEEISTKGRAGIVISGLRMWSDHRMFGVGLGNFSAFSDRYAIPEQRSPDVRAEDRFDPHNIYLAILAETGLVGLLGLLTMLAVLVTRYVKAFKQSGSVQRLYLAGIGALFVALSVVGLVHDIHLDRLWWITLGLMHGASIRRA